MKALKFLNKYLFKYRYRLILGLIFVVFTKLLSTFPAIVIRKLIDYLTISHETHGSTDQLAFRSEFEHTILLYGLLILGLAVMSGLFLYFQRQTLIGMSRLIEFDLKNEIYAHYQTLPPGFYRKNNTGDLMARISEDVSNVRMYLGPGIMYGLELAVLFLIVLPIMLSVNVRLTLFVLLPLPVLALSIYLISNVMNKRSLAIQRGLSDLSVFVQEAFSGIRVIRSFVREKDSENKFIRESDLYKKKSLHLTSINAFFFPMILTLVGLSIIIIIYIGGVEVIDGNITYGNIAEFIIYLNKLTWPVASLGWITSLVQKAAASQQRINEFLHTKTDLLSGNHKKEITGKITFENVSFTYPDTGIEALKNISFTVEAGRSLAIVGGTGSGKSTMANLMLRMYDPKEGKILIDGVNIKDYDLLSLRSQMGYVPQDVFLFSDTIRNNIMFGSLQIEEKSMLKASEDADLYHNIIHFPKGFDTLLGERGITLSGGQKQRLSIARAIARSPKILILDDCLSAVDTKTEDTILNKLQDIMKDRTTVIISHRVSSVKLAERIIVLENGQIAEEGSHEELIRKNGLYKEMYQKQLLEERSGVEKG